MAEYYRFYQFAKVFKCSKDEFEAMSHEETEWLLHIDKTYHQAVHEMQEEANRR